ncbi:MAG: hypothetical protein Q8P95_01400 [bacterium]|nr:hypothetical protein [bacterium]
MATPEQRLDQPADCSPARDILLQAQACLESQKKQGIIDRILEENIRSLHCALDDDPDVLQNVTLEILDRVLRLISDVGVLPADPRPGYCPSDGIRIDASAKVPTSPERGRDALVAHYTSLPSPVTIFFDEPTVQALQNRQPGWMETLRSRDQRIFVGGVCPVVVHVPVIPDPFESGYHRVQLMVDSHGDLIVTVLFLDHESIADGPNTPEGLQREIKGGQAFETTTIPFGADQLVRWREEQPLTVLQFDSTLAEAIKSNENIDVQALISKNPHFLTSAEVMAELGCEVRITAVGFPAGLREDQDVLVLIQSCELRDGVLHLELRYPHSPEYLKQELEQARNSIRTLRSRFAPGIPAETLKQGFLGELRNIRAQIAPLEAQVRRMLDGARKSRLLKDRWVKEYEEVLTLIQEGFFRIMVEQVSEGNFRPLESMVRELDELCVEIELTGIPVADRIGFQPAVEIMNGQSPSLSRDALLDQTQRQMREIVSLSAGKSGMEPYAEDPTAYYADKYNKQVLGIRDRQGNLVAIVVRQRVVSAPGSTDDDIMVIGCADEQDTLQRCRRRILGFMAFANSSASDDLTQPEVFLAMTGWLPLWRTFLGGRETRKVQGRAVPVATKTNNTEARFPFCVAAATGKTDSLLEKALNGSQSTTVKRRVYQHPEPLELAQVDLDRYLRYLQRDGFQVGSCTDDVRAGARSHGGEVELSQLRQAMPDLFPDLLGDGRMLQIDTQGGAMWDQLPNGPAVLAFSVLRDCQPDLDHVQFSPLPSPEFFKARLENVEKLVACLFAQCEGNPSEVVNRLDTVIMWADRAERALNHILFQAAKTGCPLNEATIHAYQQILDRFTTTRLFRSLLRKVPADHAGADEVKVDKGGGDKDYSCHVVFPAGLKAGLELLREVYVADGNHVMIEITDAVKTNQLKKADVIREIFEQGFFLSALFGGGSDPATDYVMERINELGQSLGTELSLDVNLPSITASPSAPKPSKVSVFQVNNAAGEHIGYGMVCPYLDRYLVVATGRWEHGPERALARRILLTLKQLSGGAPLIFPNDLRDDLDGRGCRLKKLNEQVSTVERTAQLPISQDPRPIEKKHVVGPEGLRNDCPPSGPPWSRAGAKTALDAQAVEPVSVPQAALQSSPPPRNGNGQKGKKGKRRKRR